MSQPPFPNADATAENVAMKEKHRWMAETLASEEYEILHTRVHAAIQQWEKDDFDCTFPIHSYDMSLDAMHLVALQLKEQGWNVECEVQPPETLHNPNRYSKMRIWKNLPPMQK
jgi:hypothetical protein